MQHLSFLLTSVRLVLSIILLTGCAATYTQKTPPLAPKNKSVTKIHGQKRYDSYAWLKNREPKKPAPIIQYLEKENNYTQYMMRKTENLQEDIYDEILSRIQETDVNVPYKMGQYLYYSRTKKGSSYPFYYRQKILGQNKLGEETLILDLNEMAKTFDYLQLGRFEISPSEHYLAFTLDTNGSEKYQLYIKDLRTNQLTKTSILDISPSFAWANDNQTIFYSREDHARRPYKVFRANIFTKKSASSPNETLLYHEKDEKFRVHIRKSKSQKYIFMDVASNITSEAYFLKATHPQQKLRLITRRKQGVEYYPYHRGNSFYLYTNYQAKNFKVVRVPIKTTSRNHWKNFIPYKKNNYIIHVETFKDYMVLIQRYKGLPQIKMIYYQTKKTVTVPQKEKVYTLWHGSNKEFNAPFFRYHYSSFVTPETVFDFYPQTKKQITKKVKKVLGGYNKSQYSMERTLVRSHDGQEIPVSFYYKKGLKKNGNNPMVLYAYGSYSSTSRPYFNPARFSLLDRGFIWAIAHVRGGSLKGRTWYDDGKLLKKKNTFKDTIQVAKYFIKKKYTSPQKISLLGGSAGGLLVGAVLNKRPNLFQSAVAMVPFVDVTNTLLDKNLPLTVIEYEEWGNPYKKKFYKYINSYSPYDNVKKTQYPHLLVTAGINDPRVGYWEPAKWVAKLRNLKTDNNLLLLKTEMGAGHGGKSGRYNQYKEVAFIYAFLIKTVGTK